MKECTNCKIQQPTENYHIKNRKKKRKDGSTHSWIGHYAECKSCWTERSVESFHKYKEYYKEYNKNYCPNKKKSSQLKYEYGITLEQYNQLLVEQEGSCSICKSVSPNRSGSNYFHVDHCHITNKVRGLLCNSCNLGLGSFKDNTIILQKAIEYLNNSLVEKVVPSITDALKGK
jgi:hypothetical protein